MHNRLLITFEAPAEADSAYVRDDAYDRLMNDYSFCGEGGRFGSPLCDWFVIGGRWSGVRGDVTGSVTSNTMTLPGLWSIA